MRKYLPLLITIFLILLPIVSATLIYETLIVREATYSKEDIIVKPVYSEINETWSKEYSYEKETVSYELVERQGKAIGYTDGKTEIIGKLANEKNGETSVWTVPQGDRNLEEFGKCRDFEIAKGVCKTIK